MVSVQGPHIKYWGSLSFNSALLPLQSGYCPTETCQGPQWLPTLLNPMIKSKSSFYPSFYYQQNLTLTLFSLKCFPHLAPGHLISSSLLGCSLSVFFGGSSSSSYPLMLEHPGVLFLDLFSSLSTPSLLVMPSTLKYYEYAHGPYISTSILDVTLWIVHINI